MTRQRVLIALTILFPLILAAVLIPATARAYEEEWPPVRNPSTTLCVRADFPETGSGWRIHAAVRAWNEAQSAVHLTTDLVPGCTTIRVYEYAGPVDGSCGHATLSAVDVGDVYLTTHVEVGLNDNCRMESPWTTRWSKYVVTHELGHALGLNHTHDEPNSVMCYCADWATNRGRPGVDDAARITTLYAAGDLEPPTRRHTADSRTFSAHADAIGPARLPNRSLCVVPDFPVTGSGWPIQAAARKWMEAQSIVTVTTSPGPDCVVVTVSRYTDTSGYACGQTSMQGVLLPEGHVSTAGTIHLNDACLRGAARRYTRAIVMHELGHAMGLDHNDDSLRSIMNTAHGAPRHLWPVDVRSLATVYGVS